MMKQSTYSFKQLLAGGLLCCLVLLAAYLFQLFCPGLYVDAFSSSIYLSMWLVLFVGALLWTFREKGTHGLPSEVTDWQCIAAFLLIIGNQIYIIMPKEFHMEMAPVLSAYTLPALFVGGLVVAGLVKLSISLHHLLENERQKVTLQAQRLQDLITSTPSEQKGMPLVRKLLENKSISQFSADEYLLLIEGCRTIDPDFFVWLKDQKLQIPPRDIVLCVLIRMRKTKEEILSIFSISDGSYRTMRSRARKRLGLEDKDMETFLQNLR